MLNRPLLEVEEALIHAHQAGSDFRASPWSEAMPVTDGGATDHEGGLGASDVPEQADLHRQLVPRQIEEHEMPTVVDLRIEVCISEPRSEGERVLCQRVYRRMPA